MNLLLNINKKIYEILFFLIFFLIGIFIFKDYGISIDEDNTRIIGFLSLENIYRTFLPDKVFQISQIIENQISAHPEKLATSGVIFDLPMAFIEYLFKIEDSQKYYELRHLSNFLFFFISVYFFYRIIKKKYNSYFFAILGALFLIISPRIFSNSFYNNKDLIFMSLCIINLYYGINFLERRNFKNSLIFAIVSGLLINVRILGIIQPSLIVFFYFINILRYEKNKNKIIYPLLFFLFLVPFFVILSWPYLWDNTIENFLTYLKNLSQHKLNIYTFYLGEFIFSPNAPWHYSIIWILITTPFFYIFLFTIGFILISYRFLSRLIKIDKNESYNDLWRGNNELKDLIFYFIFLISLIIITKSSSISYDGWRHLYFIYPSFLLIAIKGFHFLKIKFFKNKYNYIYIISLILILPSVFWMIKNHPHQYVYFNILAGKDFKKNFEMDYLGLSNKKALELIVKNDNRKVKVYNLNTADLNLSKKILQQKIRDKIIIVDNVENADYITNNYRDWKGKNRPYDFIIPKDFNIAYEIKVDNISINTIYKKR